MGQKDFYFTLVSIDLLYKLKKSAQKSWAIPSLYFASKEHFFLKEGCICLHVVRMWRTKTDLQQMKRVLKQCP